MQATPIRVELYTSPTPMMRNLRRVIDYRLEQEKKGLLIQLECDAMFSRPATFGQGRYVITGHQAAHAAAVVARIELGGELQKIAVELGVGRTLVTLIHRQMKAQGFKRPKLIRMVGDYKFEGLAQLNGKLEKVVNRLERGASMESVIAEERVSWATVTSIRNTMQAQGCILPAGRI